MGRLVMLGAVGMLLLLLVGCGTGSTGELVTTTVAGSSAAVVVTQADETTTTLPAAQTFAWGDTVELKGVRVTVSAPVEDTAPDYVEDGEKVIVAEVTVENASAEMTPYNALDYTLQDADGYTYDAWGSTSKPGLNSGDLQPGRSVKGFIAFDVPKASAPASVIYQPNFLMNDQVVWE